MIASLKWEYLDLSMVTCATLSVVAWLTFRFAVRKQDSHRYQRFRGKIVLITGASSGLGKALAREFYSAGSKLILASRDLKALRKVAQDLKSQIADVDVDFQEPECFHLDLADQSSINEFCAIILSKYSNNLDVIVNNAGASMRGESLATDINVHRRLMEVNYFGHVQLTQKLLSNILKGENATSPANDSKITGALEEGNEKWVVCISSVQGRIALPFRSAYGASKHALQAYFDSLKGELAAIGRRDVKILTVCPGYIKTNLSLNALTANGQFYGKMDENQLQGLEPEEAAKKILDAMLENRDELILADFKTKFALLLRCFLPSLYFWLVVRRAKKQLKL